MKGSEIQNLVFSVGLFGYKKSDIKAFLREISEYVLKLENKIYNLQVELNNTKSELSKAKSEIAKDEINQTDFKDLIASAHAFKNEIETKAKKTGLEMIQKSQKKCDQINDKINSKLKILEIVKREVENVKKMFLENLENFEKTVEVKEKNIYSHLNIEDISEKFEEDKKSVEEKEKNDETVEFNTKQEFNKKDDDSYIKSKFKEIELR